MKKNESSKMLTTSNIMGIVKISDELNLEKIYMGLEDSSYEPEQYSGLVYRNVDPQGTVTLFKTGKIICTGVKDKKIVKKIISDLVDKLRSLEIPVYNNYKIQIKNMVFTRTLGHPINLAKVALSFGLENVDYEPDDFPGLIFKITEPKATFILFGSGKIICTGSESNTVAEEAYSKLERKLKRYKILK
jgi:transcription initiation factor TFIID TATA-box-binding protein